MVKHDHEVMVYLILVCGRIYQLNDRVYLFFFYHETNPVFLSVVRQEVYLETSETSLMERFCENS